MRSLANQFTTMATTTQTPFDSADDGAIHARLAHELRRLAATSAGHYYSVRVELWLNGDTVRKELIWGGSVHTDILGGGCRTATGKSADVVLDALEDKDTELTDRIDDLRQRANAMLAEAAELEANA